MNTFVIYEENTRNIWYVNKLGQIMREKKKNGEKEIVKLKSNHGYAVISSSTYVHRIVAKTFIPNPENKTDVNHKDGNKKNNHVDNLEWVTKSENTRHAYSTGLLKVVHSEETKRKISESLKKYKITDEHRKNLGKCVRRAHELKKEKQINECK